MELAEYRAKQQAEQAEKQPEPSRPVYRRDFPIAEDAFAADAPERNLFAADTASLTAESEAERLAGIVAQDQGLNAEGRARKLQEGHADIGKRLLEPFTEVIDAYAQKLAGEKVSLLARVVKEAAPDAGRNAQIVEYLRDKVPDRERVSFLARLAANADSEAIAAIVAAPLIFGLIPDASTRERLVEKLLELRGGKHYDELRQHDEILAVVNTNRESASRRIRDRLLAGTNPLAASETDIKKRLVRHDNNGE